MKLLIVTYFYSTSPLYIFVGSQRAFSFAKYLPRQDMEIVVVSFSDTLHSTKHTGKYGERIYRVLDFVCVIERFIAYFKSIFSRANLPIKEITTNIQKRHSIKWYERLYIPPGRQLIWAISTFWVARQLHKTEHIDVVLTTSPYESVHWVDGF
jgi:hypothetical protein